MPIHFQEHVFKSENCPNKDSLTRSSISIVFWLHSYKTLYQICWIHLWYFDNYRNTMRLKKKKNLGCLGGSVSKPGTLDFGSGSRSQEHEIQTWVGLRAGCGAYLRFSVSLTGCPSPTLALSKINQSIKPSLWMVNARILICNLTLWTRSFLPRDSL